VRPTTGAIASAAALFVAPLSACGGSHRSFAEPTVIAGVYQDSSGVGTEVRAIPWTITVRTTSDGWCGSDLEFDGSVVHGRQPKCVDALENGITEAVEMARVGERTFYVFYAPGWRQYGVGSHAASSANPQASALASWGVSQAGPVVLVLSDGGGENVVVDVRMRDEGGAETVVSTPT
jgi:hypothetical protein